MMLAAFFYQPIVIGIYFIVMRLTDAISDMFICDVKWICVSLEFAIWYKVSCSCISNGTNRRPSVECGEIEDMFNKTQLRDRLFREHEADSETFTFVLCESGSLKHLWIIVTNLTSLLSLDPQS